MGDARDLEHLFKTLIVQQNIQYLFVFDTQFTKKGPNFADFTLMLIIFLVERGEEDVILSHVKDQNKRCRC